MKTDAIVAEYRQVLFALDNMQGTEGARSYARPSRSVLSEGQDQTLHRLPRCPGLRYVHHRWELFSRDPAQQVYLAPHTDDSLVDHQTVQVTARHVLPIAPAQHYEGRL